VIAMQPSPEPDDPREAGEDALTARIVKTMRHQLEKDYAPEATKRDAHPKHTGLLEGTFQVAPELPAELRVGIFAETRSYRAWVRTSNASAKPQSDAVRDVRGLAIKLLDVPGAKIPESDEPDTQDFVLLSTPSMPLGTVRLFHDAIVYGTRYSPLLFAAKMLLTGRSRVLKELDAVRIRPTSPLEIRYWSTTPYRFGADRVVKYSLLPTSDQVTALPPTPLAGDYLSTAMQTRLSGEDVSFAFAVQFRADGMPVHDAAPRWDETVSPFRTVATLTIPAQAFRTPERDRRSEELSFSPAHARVEHRPIGPVNRARMRVYRTNSEFRHDRSGHARLAE
jgi:hypothetical protein